MMTVLVIVFLLKGHEDVRSYAISFDPHVSVAECRAASGAALQRIPKRMIKLGWSCIEVPFVNATDL